ncbi:hypothetical protein Ddc_16248 [Ditylenchus destructor]|nr:hypothetical protein Ddc_16248 [Ditylenchus destructor]
MKYTLNNDRLAVAPTASENPGEAVHRTVHMAKSCVNVTNSDRAHIQMINDFRQPVNQSLFWIIAWGHLGLQETLSQSIVTAWGPVATRLSQSSTKGSKGRPKQRRRSKGVTQRDFPFIRDLWPFDGSVH